MKRIAFYGGSFDPVHNGHLAVAQKLTEIFKIDEFYFLPAFHAPHKKDKKPTSAFHRYAMLALATEDFEDIRISKIELEMPERPYTIETLGKLKAGMPDTRIFFVMGADSWQDITTWREWEKVLAITSHIVVTRPPIEIGFQHVTEAIREKIIDLRGKMSFELPDNDAIFITDSVSLEISASEIRGKLKDNDTGWKGYVSAETALYIEKYKLYK